MRTVYLVMIRPSGYDESDVVLGVYTTRDAAEAHQRAVGTFAHGPFYLTIEECPVWTEFVPNRPSV